MYAITYLEINTFCILLLLVILKCQLENLDKSVSARVFRELVVTVIIYVIFDIFCGLNDNDVVSFPRPFIVFVNVGFYVASYLTSYLSFLYAECEMQAKWVLDKRKRRLFALPTVALVILTLLTLKYKFFFYIDDAGNYIKGPLYFPMLVLVYGHLLAIGIKALILLPRKKYYVLRSKMITLSSFVVFPLLAGAIQAFYNGISIISMGCTMAAVQVFINMQKTRITTDALTELNNRTKMVQHLERCMTQARHGSTRVLFLLLLDIDDFKRINDKYGHLEGDRALLRLANVLKKAASTEKCMIARFGGDEFAVVLESETGSEEAFVAQLRRLLSEENERADAPYQLEVSIGCACYSPDIKSIPEFVRMADKDLYREKWSRKTIW